MTSLFQDQMSMLERTESMAIRGSVASVAGLRILVDDLPLPVGSLVVLNPDKGLGDPVRGEIVGFERQRSVVMLFGGSQGIRPGTVVHGAQSAQTINVGQCMLGRVVNAFGEPIDGAVFSMDRSPRALQPPPTAALQRRPITEPLPTGVRSIDAMTTFGKGQRVGVFAGPGVGKSTLLGCIARNTSADVNVIALVGERGREVREFIESTLGDEGLARSVVVVSTSDESPLQRVRAAFAATTIAEYFRDLGNDVLLMMDSLTRFAQAQRQIGLTAGEQPATKGYTPSVFSMLPTLLERAGAVDGGGSITGLYAVLVEGDDMTEPISDAARGILDGHIALSRRLAGRGHYPAIDLLDSVSRVADQVCDGNHQTARRDLRRLMAAYDDAEELIRIGAYARGSNEDCDVAIALNEQINEFLQQGTNVRQEFPQTCNRLLELAATASVLRDQIRTQASKQAASGGQVNS